MATEKILIFDEAGNAKRMKVRIARFLDNEPVTESDKENIRTTLDVDGSQSGTFTTPLSVTSASDSSFTGGGKVGLGLSTPLELLHLNASGGGANNRVLSRSHYGSQYADHALVLGYCAKADTTASPQMVVTENSGAGATGNPAAIRMKTGAIEFHTANAGTSGAAFSSQRWAINSTGNLVASSGVGIDFGSGGASSLLDDYERGTTAPTDASGAGLTLAGVGCNYVKIGSQVTAWVTVTYPTTSDTSTARIGNLPFAIGSSDIDRIGGFVASQDTGLSVSVLGTTGTGQVTFRKTSGAPYANSELSGKFIWFCFIYDVS